MRVVTKQLQKKKPECIICMERVSRENIGLTSCGHIFCYPCLKNSFSHKPSCPACRTALKKEDIHHVVDSRGKDGKKTKEWGSKIGYLIKFMKRTSKKVLIFSHFTPLLLKVGLIMKKNKIGHVFCRGNTAQKNASLVKFRTDKTCQAMMMSTGTSAAGANLVEAQYAIFLEPMPGAVHKQTEDQAISRLCRMGQDADYVKVFRFAIKDTIEDDIVTAAEDEKAQQLVQQLPANAHDVEQERDL